MNKFEFNKLCPFKWFVLENFPFIEADFDAITNYQLYCKVVEYLNKVIENNNAIGIQTENLTNAFIELQDYVNNYFDNLDVQDEINNKLDDMVESGTLQEIIADYLNSKAIFGFDTVNDMKNSTNLIDGSYAQTLGYYSKNDGGKALYKIRTITNDDIVDNALIISLTNNNSLIAELIIEDIMCPEMFGAYGNGQNIDTIALQKCLDNSKKTIAKGIYLVDNNININNDIDMTGNSYIKASTNLTTVVSIASGNGQQIGKNYNVNVDSNNTAQIGIVIGAPRKCKLNLKVINAGNTGIDCNYLSSTGNNENEFSCNVVGNTQGTTETGVLVNNFDSIFHAIVTQDCKYGVKLNQGELIANSVHSWLSNTVAPILWSESAVIYNVSLYTLQVNWLYQDSVKYGVLGASYGHINYFEYNNTLTNSENYTGMYNVYAESGSTRLTIDRFKNDKNENLFLSYSLGSSVASEFGVLNKNGVQSNPNVIRPNPAFTDLNNAPQWGSFYVNYDCSNVPTSINGYVECKVVGSVAIQTYYCQNYNDVPRFFIRTRELTTATWSGWKKFVYTE